MKTTNFILLYCFLFLSVGIFAQTIPNHFKEVQGGNSGYNIQRKLQEENYILVIYKEDANYSSQNFSIVSIEAENGDVWRLREFSKLVYDNQDYEDIDL